MTNERQYLLKQLNERFVKAFVTYRLLEDGDRVLIGLSGGKDSLLLTELLSRRARISHPYFSVEAIHVRMENISYNTDTEYLRQLCDDLGVPLHIVTTRFEPSDKKPPCFLCSWHRRKLLFNEAQKLNCNKIALGHHQDDVIHTALMNLTFQARFDTMPALLRLRKMPLSIIRPLCMIKESDIQRYAEMQGYKEQVKKCPYERQSHRTSMKKLFDELEQVNPEARYSIWNALVKADKLIEE